MKRRGWPVVAAWAGLVLAAGTSGTAAEPARQAVVIGNAAYVNLPPLPGCETSARLAAAGLKRAGFEVTLLANPANARIGAAFATLAEAAGPGVRVAAYVCGYVSSLGGRMFLLPVNAAVTQDSEVLSQGVVARVPFGAVAGPNVAAGLLLVDGQARPGTQAQAASGLARATDSPRAGYAFAAGTIEQGSPGLLARQLAETLDGGTLEVGAFLAGLGERNRGRQAALLSTAAPGEPAWLAGGPAPAVVEAQAPKPPPPAAPSPPPAPPPVPAPPAPPPAAQAGIDAPAELSAADRRSVQLELQRLGYYRGRVDGQYGAETANAIRQFQRDLGVPADGTLTIGQAGRLLRR